MALFVKPGCIYFGDILKPEYRPLAHQMRAAKSAAPLDLEAFAWKRIDKSRAAQLEKQYQNIGTELGIQPAKGE